MLPTTLGGFVPPFFCTLEPFTINQDEDYEMSQELRVLPEECNEFVRPPEGYVRDLDVIGNAREQASMYLHKVTGKPLDKCIAFIDKRTSVENLKQLEMRATIRSPEGDRAGTKLTLDAIINNVISKDRILSPNLVVYENPNKKKSFISDFIDGRMIERGTVKKRGFVASQNGDDMTADWCSNREATIKLLINSISGAHASPYNMLYNKTGHSSLTSTCRIATSYSNAGTERLLMGNRHLRDYKTTINNIISVITNTDYKALEEVINKYGMVCPTAEQVHALIRSSTDIYWPEDVEAHSKITNLLSTLSPLELAAYAYTGDMYSIATHNDALMRGMITDLITRPTGTVDDPDTIVSGANDDIVALVGILCQDFLAGTTVKNVKASSPENYNIYAATIAHCTKYLTDRTDFFGTLIATDNLPPSVWYFPSSIRKCVVGSDTDSTMFTVQSWVEWYFGDLRFGAEADSVTNVMIYFTSQMVAHTLAVVSRNLGVIDKDLYRLKMKNEFAFPIYMRANRAKHYATMISSKEGNVFAKPKIEIKGVALKDSKNPPAIMKALESTFEEMMLTMMAGKKIELLPILATQVRLENEVANSARTGNIKYLSSANLKDADSYKNPMGSAYLYHTLWEEVFASTYGNAPPPPYGAVKANLTINSVPKMRAWVKTLDEPIKSNMEAWMEKHGKMSMGHILLPREVVEGGIPKEISGVIDTRRMIGEMFLGWYIMLEMLGYYLRNNKNTRLLSDEIILNE